MYVYSYSEPLRDVGTTGDPVDGHESRWTRETRTIGSHGPVSAPGREAGACWALVDPDHHHRSPCLHLSIPLSSRGVSVIGDVFECDFWSQMRDLVQYKSLDFSHRLVSLELRERAVAVTALCADSPSLVFPPQECEQRARVWKWHEDSETERHVELLPPSSNTFAVR